MKTVRWWDNRRNFGLALYVGSGNPIFAFARDQAGVVIFVGNAQFNFGKAR